MLRLIEVNLFQGHKDEKLQSSDPNPCPNPKLGTRAEKHIYITNIMEILFHINQ